MRYNNSIKYAAPGRTAQQWIDAIEAHITEPKLKNAIGALVWYDVFSGENNDDARKLHKYIHGPTESEAGKIYQALVRLGVERKAAAARLFESKEVATYA